MGRKEYESKSVDLIMPILNKNNIELVDLEFVKDRGEYYLRVFIEKEGGIGIIDCENVSRAFSDLLDENDFILEEYILEVSSPGDRPFKVDRDYERNIGKYIVVKTYEPIDGKKTFDGDLKSYKDNTITLICEDKEYEICKDKIAKACVGFKF